VGELTIVPFGNHVWAGQLSRGHWQEALAFLGIAIVASIALVVSYRRRQWLGMATTVLSLASFPIGVVATSRTVGDLMAYLAVWESVIPPMLLHRSGHPRSSVPTGESRPRRLTAPPDAEAQNRPPRPARTSGHCDCSPPVSSSLPWWPSAPISSSRRSRRWATPRLPSSRSVGQPGADATDRWVDIDIVSHDSWGTASGLAPWTLEREGHRTTVSGAMDWTLLFGGRAQAEWTGERAAVDVHAERPGRSLGQATGSVIGSVNGEVPHLHTPAWLASNRRAGRRLTRPI